MEYPLLDKRLSTVATFVRAGSVVADIGTDHGYLVANLVARGVCPRAFACDIGSLPLARARDTVTRYGLMDKINLMLSDGLSALAPLDAQDIVIAGMGGELIVKILDACNWITNQSVRLILQPMTKPEELRRYLYRSGYEITQERGVCVGKHCYTVVCAHFTGKRIIEPDELAVTLGKLYGSRDEESREYIKRLLKRERRKEEGLRASALPNRKTLAAQVRERIKQMEHATGITLE